MRKQIAIIIALVASGSMLQTACSTDKKSKSSSDPASAVPEDPTIVKEDAEGGSLPGIDWSLVKFDFISPKTPEDFVGTEVEVAVAHNLPPIAKWSLYYGKSFKSTEGGVAIAEDQAPTVTKVSWNRADLEPGNYFLFAVIKYGDIQNVRFFGSSIPIEDPVGDNRTPFLSLITQINARVFAPGAAQDIEFIGVDPDGDNVLLTLELSADDGTTWSPLFKDLTIDAPELVPDPDLPGQAVYKWTVPPNAARGARYRVRLTGKDDQAKTGEAVTEKFGISATPVTYTSDIRALFQSKCISCHGSAKEPNPDGNLRADYYDNQLINGPMGDRAHNGVGNRGNQITMRTSADAKPEQQMPPGGGLTQAQSDLLQLWAWNNYQPGTQRPDATINTPADAAEVPDNADYAITYDPTDGDTANITVRIQYRLNNTGAFIDLFGGTTGSSVAVGAPATFTWTPPDVTASTPVTLRFTMEDGTGMVRIRQRNFTLIDGAAPPP